jgi:hypothetical protein
MIYLSSTPIPQPKLVGVNLGLVSRFIASLQATVEYLSAAR